MCARSTLDSSQSNYICCWSLYNVCSEINAYLTLTLIKYVFHRKRFLQIVYKSKKTRVGVVFLKRVHIAVCVCICGAVTIGTAYNCCRCTWRNWTATRTNSCSSCCSQTATSTTRVPPGQMMSLGSSYVISRTRYVARPRWRVGRWTASWPGLRTDLDWMAETQHQIHRRTTVRWVSLDRAVSHAVTPWEICRSTCSTSPASWLTSPPHNCSLPLLLLTTLQRILPLALRLLLQLFSSFTWCQLVEC